MNKEALFTKEWDYSILAKTYDKRAEYSDSAIDFIYNISKIKNESLIADIGAGTAKLAKLLLEKGSEVHAVEPNPEMKKIGIENTKGKKVKWIEGNSHSTTLDTSTYDLVTFGSSFNVADRTLALKEVKRIVKPGGWFVCMWNHRSLTDPLQSKIENILKSSVSSYDYGLRRENQSEFLENSYFFSKIFYGYFPFEVNINVEDFYSAWESHGTLAKETKDKRDKVLEEIRNLLKNSSIIRVPYATRIWVGKMI